MTTTEPTYTPVADTARRLAAAGCNSARCLAEQQEMHAMRRILMPVMQPGASPVDALMYLIDQAKKVQRTRDAYRAALNRVTALYVAAEQHADGTVRTEALCRAMFVTEDDTP